MRHAILGLVLLASIPLGWPRGVLPALSGAEGKADERGPAGWASLEDGLRELRESRKPALIVLDAAEGESPAFLETVESPSLKRLRRQFVCIRLLRKDLAEPYPEKASEAAPPGEDAKETPKGAGKESTPTIAERLKLLDDVSSLVVLSFRESIVARFDRDAPTPYRLSKALASILKVHVLHVAGAEKVDRALRASRYAVGVGKQRDAVRILLPLLEEREQRLLDDVARRDLDALVAEYKAKAKKEMDAADRLDADAKYRQAIETLEEVITDYPFKDVLQQANRRKGEIFRKMTYGF